MNPRDWLILLLGFSGAGGSPLLDPVRVQKGMFLVANEAGLPASEAYTFEPYNWGPYSRELRTGLDRLVIEGYAQARPVPGYSWKEYGLTEAGVDVARQLLTEAPNATAHAVAEIKQRVTGTSFNKLLDQVYAAYPDFAANSLFRA